MEPIDIAQIEVNQTFGMLIGLMISVIMFAVALDLQWEQFRRILKNPKGPSVGLMSQFVLLPAIAFLIGMTFIDTPSVALGLLLIASCPAGAISNYLTDICRGNVATSVSMTAVGTVVCIVATPLVFAFWASMHPEVSALMRAVDVDPKLAAAMFLIGIGIPVFGGMLLRARRPRIAAAIRPWVRPAAGVLFALVVSVAITNYAPLVIEFARQALVPVVLTIIATVLASWLVARLAQLSEGDHRAVVFEVGGQNVAIGLGMAVTFFPTLGGVAVTVAAWGFVQLIIYPSMVALWAWLLPRPQLS